MAEHVQCVKFLILVGLNQDFGRYRSTLHWIVMEGNLPALKVITHGDRSSICSSHAVAEVCASHAHLVAEVALKSRL